MLQCLRIRLRFPSSLVKSRARTLSHITEPTLGQPIELGAPREHMRDMRKYQHRVAVWGGTGPDDQTAMRVSMPRITTVTVPAHTCQHVVMGPVATAMSAVNSFNLFPHTVDVVRRLDEDGLRADWTRVGRDMSRAMTSWSFVNGGKFHERKSG